MAKPTLVRNHAAGRSRRVREMAQFLAEHRDHFEEVLVVYTTVEGTMNWSSTTTNRLITAGLASYAQASILEEE